MPWGLPWGQRWGARRQWHVGDQGYERANTPDCMFLSKDDSNTRANLAVDRSQYATNLTYANTRLIDTDSPLADVMHRRTFDMLTGWTSASTGYLYETNTVLISVLNGNPTVWIRTAPSTWLTTTMTVTIDSATFTRFLLSWATEPNPDTTGSSDAYRSELRVWNLEAGTFQQEVWTHAAEITDPDKEIAFCGSINNTSNIWPRQVYAIRLCKAFHSATETYRTWVSRGDQPSVAGEVRLEPPMPPRSSGIGDDGQYAGPVYALAAAHARQQDLRLWTPILNDVYDPDYAPTFQGTPTGDRTQLQDPNDTTWYLQFPFIRHRPLPPNCNRMLVRVNLRVDVASIGASGTINVRCYSMSQPGWTNKPATSPSQPVRFFRSAAVAVDDDNTGDVWLEFENLRPARDMAEWTYLALAFLPTSETVTWQVLAFEADPVRDLDTSSPHNGSGSVGG